MGFMKPEQASANSQASASAQGLTSEPRPVAPIQGSRPKRKPMTPSFLGQDSTPNMGGAGGGGGKTLIGQ